MNANENELERLEAELRRVRPARLSPDLLQRLTTDAPQQVSQHAVGIEARKPSRPDSTGALRGFKAAVVALHEWVPSPVRWLVPATALVVLCGMIWLAKGPGGSSAQASVGAVKADDVQIDQQLVSTFDTVAPLATGEPVRFRCRQWVDQMVLRDSKRGVEVTRRVPRLEVVPVRFETY